MFENRAVSIAKLVNTILRDGDIRDGRGVSVEQRNRIRAEFELMRPDDFHFSEPINYKYSSSGANLSLFDVIDARHDSMNRIDLLGFTAEPAVSFCPELEFVTMARAKIIAFAFMEKHRLDLLTLGIFWYRRDSLVPSEYFETVTRDVLVHEAERWILTWLEWARPFQGWKAIRDASIRETEFPFSPYRNGQREMMAQIFTAAKRHEQRLIEAPTGIGKTMASLFPSIKSLETGTIHRIFYATARNTGQEMVRDAVALLHSKGLRLKSVTITSKDKSCARRDAIRECDDCPYSMGYYARLRDGVHAAFRSDVLSRELIDGIGREFYLCPFELSLDLSLHADLIICDYNYIFDPNVALKRFFAEIEENYLFLIDEVHNLVDRARGMYSGVISELALRELWKLTGMALPDLADQISTVTDILSLYRARAVQTGNVSVDQVPPYDLLKQLRTMLKIMDEWMAHKDKRPYRKTLLEIYFDVRHFCSMAEQFDENYCAVAEKSDSDFTLTLYCSNPAPHLRKRLNWAASASLFSATVSPNHYFREVLGMSETAQTLNLPSPFNPDHLKLLIADPVSTKLAHREVTLTEVIGAIETVVNSRSGNYMAFFPSYDYMNRVSKEFVKRNRSVEVAIQTPNMTDEDRKIYLDHFTRERSGSKDHFVGFAVMGGIFGEGVDLVGDKLNGVIVVGVGLPGICAEREQIRRRFDSDNNGFDYAYTWPGLTKVLQAAGRVIRTESDRGVVLLIDERFGREKYRKLFPIHWHPEIVKNRDDILAQVQGFYAEEESSAELVECILS